MNRQQDIERLAKGMGLCLHSFKWADYESSHRFEDYNAEVCRHCGLKVKKWEKPNTVWNPFESWHDAGMVWEAMMQKGYQPCVNWLEGIGGYHASFFFAETRTFYDSCGCATAPAAIAEAALRVWDKEGRRHEG